jgi:hypothetical protein
MKNPPNSSTAPITVSQPSGLNASQDAPENASVDLCTEAFARSLATDAERYRDSIP